MEGDAVYAATNDRSDMTTKFVDAAETIDLSNKPVDDYTYAVHLHASKDSTPGTSMQGTLVHKSQQIVNAQLLTLEPNSVPWKAGFLSPPPASTIDGGLDWLTKLTRINYLLAEAAQLQSEVFK